MKRILMMLITILLLLSGLAYSESDRSITAKSRKKASEASISGNYYALIIGNNNYKNLPKLRTAANDARAIEKMLKERYGFRTKLLIDATRDDILDSLNELRESIGSNENILIYYAGHGEYDKTVEKAYWLPVDARKDRTTNWIIADDITSNLKRVSSKHILLVSDSCYSGTLTRAATAELNSKSERDEYIRKMLERPSRTLMASGGNEPVADGGGGNNSVFAAALIKALGEADKAQFTADELFHGRVRAIVAGKSDQVPEYHDIKNSGHEGGDFVFQFAKAMTAGPSKFNVSSTAIEFSEESKKLQEEKEKLRKEREEFEQAKALIEDRKRLEEERRKLEEEKLELAKAQKPMEIKSNKSLLFPADGVTLGKTTVAELSQLGGKEDNQFALYVINGNNVWYENNIADHYYFTYTDKLPEKWQSIGMNFGKSYNEWIALAQKYGWQINVVETPHIEKYNAIDSVYDSFYANLSFLYQENEMNYEIILDFKYSEGTTEIDPNTLYSLDVKYKP